ncbi:MAG: DUF5693 family protein [bacterium]
MMINTNWLLTQINRIFFTTAVLISVIIAAGRVGIERNYHQVELVMDYYDLIRLVRERGEEGRLKDWVSRFKEAGITSLILEEETLKGLSEDGKITVFNGRQMRDFFRINGLMNPYIWNMIEDGPTRLDQTYILTSDYHLAQQISGNLKTRIDQAPENFTLPSEEGGKDGYLIVAAGTAPSVLELGIGFSPELIEWVKSQGLSCMLRPNNLSLREGTVDPDDFFDQVKDWPSVKGVIFSGTEVLGYPEFLTVTGKRLKESGLKLGIIEFTPQKGMKGLLTELAGRRGVETNQSVVRVYGLGPKEVEEITLETVLSRMLRAVKERGIRLLYLRPLNQDGKGDPLKANLNLVRTLTERLNKAGFSIGTNNGWPGYEITSLALFFICLGVMAACGKLYFLLGGRVGLNHHLGHGDPPETRFLMYLLLGGSLFSLLIFTSMRPFIQQGFAFLAAFTFPVLAILRARSLSPLSSPHFSLLIKESWKDLGQVTLTTGLGALLIVGLLSETTYLLKIEQFRGVKLSFILPLIGLGLIFLKDQGLTSLLDRPIKLIHLIMGGIILVGAVFVLARSGNFGPISVLPFEAELRVWFENYLWARPRLKEFLVGYPALLAGLFLLREGRFGSLPVWFLIIGALSQVSLINTFCHLHTPLLFSVIRSSNGFWIGSLLGTAFLGFYYYTFAYHRDSRSIA